MPKAKDIVALGKLLDRIQAFEDRMERLYTRVRDRTEDNRVRMLTYYMARHRRHQQIALATVPRTRVGRARRVRVCVSAGLDPSKRHALRPGSVARLTGTQMLSGAEGYDRALIELYRSLLTPALDACARAVLEALVLQEQRDLAMLKKMSDMRYF